MSAEPTPGGGEPPDILEQRVSLVEVGLADVREQVARAGEDGRAARDLAAGADRDVSEVSVTLHAHRQLLNALGESQSEFRREVNARFAVLDAKVDAGFAEMRAGFAAIGTTLERIIADGR